jgi:hypothetical protein
VPRVVAASGALVAACALLALRVEPVPTWFYVFAWYPTLVLLDAAATRLDGRPSLLTRCALVASLFTWSAIIWLAFEAANFRLENWYYVSLPAHAAERWSGILLSFATVVPAIVLAERTLAAGGAFARLGGPRVTVRARELNASVVLGLAAVALCLVWPRWFFPLVWGAGWALAEPLVYRRQPALSLYRDLARGDWGRVSRLLLGGLGIGLLWELYNHLAEGRWIYTVPGLEHVKLFEMPPLGFLGFPVFALEAWAMYAALCALRVAVPVTGHGRVRAGRTAAAGATAAAVAILTLIGMERYTISSTVPGRENLATLTPAAAELAALRGMGVAHARTLGALGITQVCELVDRDPQALADTLRRRRPGQRPTAAEVRVWVRAAERVCR